MSLPGRKVALVTGGARRIGATISRKLAGEGFAVALTYRTSGPEARSLAREVGGHAFFLDLLRPRGNPRFSEAVRRKFGRLDLLVHNAAVFPRMPVGTVLHRDWDRIFAVNLRGPFLLTQALLPLLREAPGAAVLFLGDAGAARLWPAYLPYCLSKLALAHQAAAWEKILGPKVRVGVVKPGFALAPPGFPEGEWRRLRSRGGVRGPDTPDKVAESVLRFFRRVRYNSPVSNTPKRRVAMTKWRCNVCAYVYDPAVGDPEHGVKPGTPFGNLPDDWTCPLCGVGKEDFEEIKE